MKISLPNRAWTRRWLTGFLALVLACGALVAVNIGSKRAEALLPVSPWSFATIGVTVAGQGGLGNAVDQLETPSGLTLDAGNNIFVADTANSRVQKCVTSSASCTTVAGQGGVGSGTDQLDHPRGVALDTAGNIYIADTANSRIQKCVPEALTCSTVAGQGGQGFDADQLDTPSGIAVDANGNIYIADTANSRIQKCAPEALTCTTVAGQSGNGSGASQLDHPRGIALDASGNIYIADTANSRIQKCVPEALTCTTIAGQGGLGSAYDQLSSPSGLAVDKSGNVYVADTGNSRVQFCTVLLECTTPVGTQGPGPSTDQLDAARGVAVDTTGNLYIGDTGNNRVVEYYLKIVTVAGSGSQGYTQPDLRGPAGVAVDAGGNIYIADTGNNRVLKCVPGSRVCTTVAGGNGEGSGSSQLAYPSAVAVDATGNIYIADASNYRVQKCEPGSPSCTTVAGGNGYGSGANQLTRPLGLAVDAAGNIYIADPDNYRVQKCAPGSSSCSTVAGGNGYGSGANQLKRPHGLAVDATGNIYIADPDNYRVQKCVSGSPSCTTFAGEADRSRWGLGADQLSYPNGVAVGTDGNIYIEDVGHYPERTDRIQKCEPGSTACTTVAGGIWCPNSGFYYVLCNGANQLNNPIGLAVDVAGNIYVADANNNRVQKCVPGSTSCMSVAGLNTYGPGDDELFEPSAVALDASGNIYIADSGNSRLQRCEPSSTGCIFVADIASKQTLVDPYDFTALLGMALDASGNIYITNRHTNSVVQCTPSWNCAGVAEQIFGPIDDGSDSQGLAVDASGRIYISDIRTNSVKRCELGPTVCTTVAGGNGWGSEPNQLAAPRGLAVDVTGNIYIADSGNGRVQKCQPDATFCTTVADVRLGAQSGLAVDTEGNIYISDRYLNIVWKCEPGRTACVTVAGGNGEGLGSDQLHDPRGLAVDVSGNVYIADTQNHRIQKVNPAWLDQQITFDPISAPSTFSSVGLSARASSGASVSFVSDTPSTCTTSGATVTVIAAGTCTVTARQDGEFPFTAAAPVSRTLGVVLPPPTTTTTTSTTTTTPTSLRTALRLADSGANEGSGPAGTTISVMFGTDRPTSAPVCVWYSTVGATAAGADTITAWDGTQDFMRLGVSKPKFVILGTNRTSGKISTKINYDTTPEEDEYFNVVVSKVTTKVSDKCDPTSAADPRFVLVRDTGKVTIHDDDTKGSQTAFRVADSGATEGSGPLGTTVSVMFGMDRPTAAPLCVWYSTVGVSATGVDKITAWDGTQDFTRLGISTPKYVILGTNRTSGKISTKINYDTAIEEGEYFNIVVSKVTAQVGGRCSSTSLADPGVVLTRDTGRVTIFDDDTPQG